MAQRIVIHPGFMKTGSTFLQNAVFPRLPDVALHSYGDGRRFVDAALRVRSGRTPPDCPEAIAEVRGWLNESDRPTQLFSWEGLIGGYLNDYRERDVMLSFLKGAFPEARILLVIRRQDRLAESLYRQSLHNYHYATAAAFLNRTGDGFGAFRPGLAANLDVRSLAFAPFVDAYERVFGAGSVTVLPYEWMLASPDRFYGRLSDVLQTRVEPPPAGTRGENRGYSLLAARIAMTVNRFYRTRHNPRGLLSTRLLDPRRLLQSGLDRLIYVEGDLLPKAWRDEILALHAEGNRALDARYDLGLGALGYYDQ